MSEKDIFSQREHWLEETYFRKRDEELIARLHARQTHEIERDHIAASTGIRDPQMLEQLLKDGYTEETIALLPIVPLIEVAWAEGGVADRERRMILEIARSRGIESGSTAHKQLLQWLEERPAGQFFEDTLHAIRQMFEQLPMPERQTSRESLIAYCTKVAALASGGILGRGQIPDEERALIAHIAEEIGRGREETVRKVIER